MIMRKRERELIQEIFKKNYQKIILIYWLGRGSLCQLIQDNLIHVRR